MERVSKTCKICSHEKREEIDGDLNASLSYREVAKRWGVDKSTLYRHHRRHMRPVLPEGAAYDLGSALATAYGALARAQRRNDLRAMDLALSLIQKLQNAGNATVAEGQGPDLSTQTSDQLANRRKDLLRVIRENSTDDALRQEICEIQTILDSRAALSAEDSQAEDSRSGQ